MEPSPKKKQSDVKATLPSQDPVTRTKSVKPVEDKQLTAATKPAATKPTQPAAAAKPAQPAAAKLTSTAVAKSVQPAQPVAAKLAGTAAAKSVQPTQPAQPPAAKPAKPTVQTVAPVIKTTAVKEEEPSDDDDDDDDESDETLDFDNLSDNEDDDDDDEDDDNDDDELEIEVAGAGDEVFDIDKFKKGSSFDQDGAERAFVDWKKKRERKPPSWFNAVVLPEIDDDVFKNSRRQMTQRLIDSYKVKLAKLEASLTEPNLSKADLKELKSLQRQYKENIAAREREL